MKRMNIRKTLNSVALLGGTIMAASALAQTQGGSGYGMGSGMMGVYGAGWMDGGYGGIWVPVLLVIVVVGLVAWFVAQKRKYCDQSCLGSFPALTGTAGIWAGPAKIPRCVPAAVNQNESAASNP